MSDLPSPNEALNEYFKLKKKFEEEKKVAIKKIKERTNNRNLRAAYSKLMLKCINCRKPSKLGTIFSITYQPYSGGVDSYRTFRCSCGNVADPCNLNIEINVGIYRTLNENLEGARELINENKNKIIDVKNQLLFGLTTTETAIDLFEKYKRSVEEMTQVFEILLDNYNNIFENPRLREELDQSIALFYQNVNSVKECIKKMHENDDVNYAEDAANIYATKIEPLLKKIRYLKYKENFVYIDENDICTLVQNRHTIQDTLTSTYGDKVVAYDVGLKIVKKPNANNDLITQQLDANSDANSNASSLSGKFQLKINAEQKGGFDEAEEPIIGKGESGISWNNPEYQAVWVKLPDELKNAFKLNIDWLKEFMSVCMSMPSEKRNAVNCHLTTPPNIVIPPREMDNGDYDFGVTIYNDTFKKQPKELQKSFLTYYKEDPITKAKDYTQLEEALNRMVESQVGYNKAFF